MNKTCCGFISADNQRGVEAMNPFLYFSSFVYKANERLCSDVNNNVYEIRVFLTTKSLSRDRSFITKSLN